MLSENNILKLKAEIETKANPYSKIYEKLLEWQERFSNHYAIGLSDEYMFSTGETFAVIQTSKYRLKHIPTKALNSDIVIKRLLHSFH